MFFPRHLFSRPLRMIFSFFLVNWRFFSCSVTEFAFGHPEPFFSLQEVSSGVGISAFFSAFPTPADPLRLCSPPVVGIRSFLPLFSLSDSACVVCFFFDPVSSPISRWGIALPLSQMELRCASEIVHLMVSSPPSFLSCQLTASAPLESSFRDFLKNKPPPQHLF